MDWLAQTISTWQSWYLPDGSAEGGLQEKGVKEVLPEEGASENNFVLMIEEDDDAERLASENNFVLMIEEDDDAERLDESSSLGSPEEIWEAGSEAVVEVYIEEARLIGPGTKSICRAAVLIWSKIQKEPCLRNGRKPNSILVGLSHYLILSSLWI